MSKNTEVTITLIDGEVDWLRAKAPVVDLAKTYNHALDSLVLKLAAALPKPEIKAGDRVRAGRHGKVAMVFARFGDWAWVAELGDSQPFHVDQLERV